MAQNYNDYSIKSLGSTIPPQLAVETDIAYQKLREALGGEVEARNRCHRHFLTAEERLRKLRTVTQDVPDNEQIIL